jgi:uncharacterized protein
MNSRNGASNDARQPGAVKEPHPAFPNATQAVALIAVLFFLQILIGVVVNRIGLPEDMNRSDVGALATIVSNVVLLRWLLGYKRLGYAELFHPARHSVRATLILLAAPVLMIIPGLMVCVGVAVGFLVDRFPMSDAEKELFAAMSAGGVVTLAFVCVLGPVIEEMLFRGVILRSFLRQYPRWGAIWGSAVLFGLFHLNIYQFATGLVLGVVLGWLYERSRSLWPCIILHAAYNTAITWLAAVTITEEMVLPMLATAAAGAYLLHRFLISRPSEPRRAA